MTAAGACDGGSCKPRKISFEDVHQGENAKYARAFDEERGRYAREFLEQRKLAEELESKEHGAAKDKGHEFS